jgi:predicted RNase H-like nuclease
MQVLGVDVWAKGWVGVEFDNAKFIRSHTSPSLRSVIAKTTGVAVVTVDIPLGLADSGLRIADGEAYAALGPRRSSVFPTAPRAVYEKDTYEEAAQVHSNLLGKGMSRQSYGLRNRLLEADRLYDGSVPLYEVHPEVCFAYMGAGPCHFSKKTWAGQRDRIRRLEAVGIILPDALGDASVVPVDDVLDAAAAAWSADRIARDMGASLPSPPQVNDRGQSMAIWY